MFINNANRDLLRQPNAKVHICFKGKWLSSLSSKPSKEDISSWSNKQEFLCKSLSPEQLSSLSLPNNKLKPLSGNYTGFNFIDLSGNGTEAPSKCSDTLIQFLFVPVESDPETTLFDIVGKGDSDMGKFIVSGTYHSQTREMELTRQYVSDNDSRIVCSLQDLHFLIKSEKSRVADLQSKQQRIDIPNTTLLNKELNSNNDDMTMNIQNSTCV